MHMAVGIIIGAAFTAIVTSLTDNIINPFITFITGGHGTDVGGLAIPITDTVSIDFGAFISAIINFLIIALVVFFLVKAINKIQNLGGDIEKKLTHKDGEEVIEIAPTCPYCLEEIRVGATRCSHCAAELPKPAEATFEPAK